MTVADEVTHLYLDLDFGSDFTVTQDQCEELVRRITDAPVAIREALAGFVPDADRFQGQVIEAKEKTIRLVAPAGSGKTQTMVNRVLTRVKNGLAPARSLLLTFDNSAVTSLKEKLQEMEGRFKTSLRDVRISTLNAFGFWLLREFVPKEFKEIIPDYRRRRLFREVFEGLKTKSRERADA